MKKVAISQSNYIPWKGYFDLIDQVDEFVLYDDMQYTKRDWRNRNKIKLQNQLSWLSIPVLVKGKYFQKISETTISDSNWSEKHWNSIKHAYAKAPFFKEYKDWLEDLFLNKSKNLEHLSEVNFLFINEICKFLEIETNIKWSSDFELVDGQTEKLLGVCKDLESNLYLSGPAAKNYLDEDLFSNEKIEVQWMNYDNYPEYKQLHGGFEHGVSILDVILNTGKDAKKYALRRHFE